MRMIVTIVQKNNSNINSNKPNSSDKCIITVTNIVVEAVVPVVTTTVVLIVSPTVRIIMIIQIRLGRLAITRFDSNNSTSQ